LQLALEQESVLELVREQQQQAQEREQESVREQQQQALELARVQHQRLQQQQLLFQLARCRLQQPESQSEFQKLAMALRYLPCRLILQTVAHQQRLCRQLF
jgi:hypothetical protein